MKFRYLMIGTAAVLLAGAVSACSNPTITSSESQTAVLVDNISSSIYSTVTFDESYDFSNLKVGQNLGFTIIPEQDYTVASVTNSGTVVESDGDNHYTVTLKSGSNRLTATYDLDPTVNVVEQFKLNVSEATFADIMERWARVDLDFRKDGIEQAQTLYTWTEISGEDEESYFINYVDGDTTHVETLHYGYTVKIRYLSIDTPESTSELEEWGKSASLYNQGQLEKAKRIILQSQGRAMYPDDSTKWASTTDSNGRNLAYVWYSEVENPTIDDFKCLNLEMVYQGFSFGVGSIEDCGLEFYKALDKANRSAELNKRGMYSGELDPNYWYDDPVEVTMAEIYEGTINGGTTMANGNPNPLVDEKTLYKVKGYVSRKVGGAFYFQDNYDYEQTGTEPVDAYGLYVFTYAQTSIQVGQYISVVGVLSEYSGTLQMMGVSWKTINPDPERDITIIDETKQTIVPIKVASSDWNDASYSYNHVLVELVDDVYSYGPTQKLGTLQPDGGSHSINHYNEKYPFYNTSNKCIFFGGLGSTSGTGIRMTLDQEILLSYGTEISYTYKFFTGGTNYYYPGYPEYVAYIQGEDIDAVSGYGNPFEDFEDEWNEHKDDPELQTEVYTRKQFHLTGISQYYVSTSGKNACYTVNIVASGDVSVTATF